MKTYSVHWTSPTHYGVTVVRARTVKAAMNYVRKVHKDATVVEVPGFVA